MDGCCKACSACFCISDGLPAIEVPACLNLDRRVEAQRRRGDKLLAKTGLTVEQYVKEVNWDQMLQPSAHGVHESESDDAFPEIILRTRRSHVKQTRPPLSNISLFQPGSIQVVETKHIQQKETFLLYRYGVSDIRQGLMHPRPSPSGKAVSGKTPMTVVKVHKPTSSKEKGKKGHK